MPEPSQQSVDERTQLGLPPVAEEEAGRLAARLSGRELIARIRRGTRKAIPLTLRAMIATIFDATAWRTDVGRALDRGMAALFVPVLLCAGALGYFALPSEPGWWWVAVPTAVVAVAVALTTPGSTVRLLLAALLLSGIGALAGKIETWRAATPMLGAEVTTRISGRIVTIERQAAGRARLVIDIETTERPTLRFPPARVRVTARELAPEAVPGDRVSGLVRMFPPSGPVRPGSYDFAFESYFDGIGASGFFMGKPTVVHAIGSLGIAARIEQVRYAMAGRIEASIGGAEGAIAAALITGIRAGIPQPINDDLRTVGLYHVISISGLHMALVAGTIMVGMRLLLALFPTFASRRATKKLAAATALAATGFYLALSGGEVAAQRSFIMLAVMLLAVLFDRAALTLRNLAISAVAIILVTPHEVVGPSFQMSFAATAALVAAYEAWSHRRRRQLRGSRRAGPIGTTVRAIWSNAAGLAATSLIAGTATALFSAWHFQQVAPLGLIANLAAMPFVSVLVMPFAVMAVLAMPFGADAPALWVMGQGIAAMNAVAAWLAPHSALDSTGMIPLPAVLVLTLALALLTLASGRLRMMSAPLLLLGGALMFMRATPDMLVSEDARLVALRMADGNVSTNLARPPGFSADNWRRAMSVDVLQKPAKSARRDNATGQFVCSGDVCLASVKGLSVVRAANSTAALPHCRVDTLVIIAQADDPGNCAARGATVLSARDLARGGSASVMLTGISGNAFAVTQAIAEPFRPWHEHRAFSRSARGMPARVREQPPRQNTTKPERAPRERKPMTQPAAPQAALIPVSSAGSARPDGPAP